MRLFFCATQESFEFLVTTHEDRALQLYAIYLALGKAGSSKAWVKELVSGKIIPPHADHLWEALSGPTEGFLRYRDGDGWLVLPIEREFDVLADANVGDEA